MKKTKLLYLGLFLVAFFAVVVALGSINAPQEQKTAEETKCVASALGNSPLVNGLGKDIKIPLFPDAKRFSFADTGASQYLAKAQDVEILSFYADRMASLCWQVKEQNQNQVVYSQDDKTVHVSLLTNPNGKTVIDYVVLSPEGVLGTVKVAQASCTSDQYYCNGGCVANGTSCPAPTDASSCGGGTIWCPSQSGSGGWCQMPPCPSPTTSGPTCSGSYQQSGMTAPSCNWSVCPNGCTWDSTGCPNGCSSASSSYTPPTSTSCTGGQIWCAPSSGGAGWCQMPPCPSSTPAANSCSGSYQQPNITTPSCNWSACPNGCTWDSTGCPNGCTSAPTSSSCTGSQVWCPGVNGATGWCQNPPCPTTGGYTYCPAGQYMCNNVCMPSNSYCPPSGGGTDSGSCTGGQVWCPSSSGSGGWCQMSPCPTSTGTSCPSGQYMCNGACTPNSSTCSPTAWPTDSASCTSQGKSWCTPTGGGAGWCQTSPCPTTSSCPAGQYMCNGACIANSSTCPSTSGWPTDQATCATRGYFWCPGSSGSSGWCSSTSCPNYSATCPDGQWNCDGTCISTGMSCNGQPYTGAKSNQPTQRPPQQQQQPPYNQGQYQPGPGDQYGQPGGPGPGGQWSGPSEEDQKRMQEQQFQMMKKGMNQFAKGVTQMTKFVNQMKTKLAKSGVGIPAELTNALTAAPALVAKLKASKDMDEFQELMGDMQDIGMIMQEWGPKLGELQRLVHMIKNLDRDVKSMRANFTRVQKAAKKRPELAEPLAEVGALFNDMVKRVAEIKALAKTDPEGALDLVQEFYSDTEEFWNQVSFLDMVSNVTRGLTQANRQIRQIESKIRTMEKKKGVDKEMIATLKEMVAAVKAALPELKAAMAARPVDYEEVRFLAEDFWMQLQDLQNMMADQGQSFYMPTVKQGQGINVVIPEGFTGNSGGGGQAVPMTTSPAF